FIVYSSSPLLHGIRGRRAWARRAAQHRSERHSVIPGHIPIHAGVRIRISTRRREAIAAEVGASFLRSKFDVRYWESRFTLLIGCSWHGQGGMVFHGHRTAGFIGFAR